MLSFWQFPQFQALLSVLRGRTFEKRVPQTTVIEVAGNGTAEYNKRVELSTIVLATNVPYSFQTEPIPITEFKSGTNDYYIIHAFARNFKGSDGYGNIKILYPPPVSKE
jgi:hypothetical protein